MCYVYYVTIAPYNSKIICLLKRARKGHQLQVCSSGLFVNQVYSLFVILKLSLCVDIFGYKRRRTWRCKSLLRFQMKTSLEPQGLLYTKRKQKKRSMTQDLTPKRTMLIS